MDKVTSISSEAEDVLEQLRSGLLSLTPAERKVADVVLLDPVAILDNSVTQLATVAEVSSATVVRMCNSLGLRGFQDLKTQIAIQYVPSGIADSPALENPVAEILRESGKALADAATVIDSGAVEQVATEIAEARRIHVVAVGTSSMLASDFVYRASMLGLQASFTPDVHAQHVQAKMLGPQDVLFAISHTGSTLESISATQAARGAGARIIALTSFARSPLTELCDTYVIAGSAETRVRVEAVSSRLVHMAVLDAIQAILRVRVPGAEESLRATSDIIAEHRY